MFCYSYFLWLLAVYMNFKRILSFFQKQTKPYLLANYIPTVHTFSIIESETKQNLWNLSLKSYDEHEYFAGIDYILLYLQNSFNEFKKVSID